ncbi:hypothetical protein LTR53_018521, partial [Teratosphaeriaceae sp. CCFEE 6253]
MEGVLELLGMQGPLLGLLQTSTFCTLLVICTIVGAACLPYLWGKLVLSGVVGSPGYFFVKLPLQIAGGVADVVVDVTLFVVGWGVVGGMVALDAGLRVAGARMEGLRGWGGWEWVGELAATTAGKSGIRLRDLVLTQESIE